MRRSLYVIWALHELPLSNDHIRALIRLTRPDWKNVTRVKHVQNAHTEGILCIAYSPDGTQFVTSSNDKSLSIWNADGTLIRCIPDAQRSIITTIHYSPDGSGFVTAAGREFAIWHNNGMFVYMNSTLIPDDIVSLVYSPCGKQFVVISDTTCTIVDSDVRKRTRVHTTKNVVNEWFTCVDYSSNGTHFVTGRGSVWELWNPDGSLFNSDCTGTPITCAKYLPNGSQFVTGSDNGDVMIWSSTGDIIRQRDARNLYDHFMGVAKIECAPDSATFFTLSSWNMIRWSSSGNQLDYSVDVDVVDCAHSPVDGHLTTIDKEGVVVVGDSSGRTVARSKSGLRSLDVDTIRWCPYGTQFVVACGTSLMIWKP